MDLFNDIEKLIDNNSIKEIAMLNISNSTSNKLFDYQEKHLLSLLYLISIEKNQCILDGSDTGTGKTYTTCALCKELNLKLLIICPKSVLHNWRKVTKYFNIEKNVIEIINYDMIRKNVGNYLDLPKNTIIIFDEAQKCKNHKTLNGKLLKTFFENKNRIMLLSASIADEPKNFELFGYILGFYKTLKHSKNWINGVLSEDNRLINKKQSTIYKRIFPIKGSRLCINELGNSFSSNQISSECIDLDDITTKFINDNYDEFNNKYIKNNNFNSVLEQSTNIMKKIEKAKALAYMETIDDYLDNKYSVVVFVNYNDTRKILQNKYKNHATIHGQQSSDEREYNINQFQSNKKKIIICNIKAGGTGLSLHDIHGCHPRISVIFPNFSSNDLIQSLGRIHRAGAKTPSLQRIIFVANTFEENIADKLNKKLEFSKKLSNDINLIPFIDISKN